MNQTCNFFFFFFYLLPNTEAGSKLNVKSPIVSGEESPLSALQQLTASDAAGGREEIQNLPEEVTSGPHRRAFPAQAYIPQETFLRQLLDSESEAAEQLPTSRTVQAVTPTAKHLCSSPPASTPHLPVGVTG